MAVEYPTHARHWVIVFAAALAGICYVDRVAIAQAAPFIAVDLKLTSVQIGYILSAFSWSYMLFEIPSGWLGDRIGPKLALVRVVLFWSAFTAFTAAVWNFISLFTARLLFGTGEAGCFPNITKAFSVWIPAEEQPRAQGIIWMSARLGGAVAPYFVVLMLEYFTWRRAFVLLGALGVVWSLCFSIWFKDDPRTHPGVNAAEKALLPVPEVVRHVGKIPWKRLLTSKVVWLLSVQYFCLAYSWQFYVTWLPTYLVEVRHIPLRAAGLLAGLPLLMGACACLLSALIYPRLIIRLRTRQRAWCAMSYLGFLGAALFLLLSMTIHNPFGAVVAMSLASFSNDLTLPGIWAAVTEVGGPIAGTTSAFMNMLSCFGGALEAILTGYIIHWTNGNWSIAFGSFVAVYAIGFVCWLALAPLLTNPSENIQLA